LGVRENGEKRKKREKREEIRRDKKR